MSSMDVPRLRDGQALTVRQAEMLYLIARGLTNDRIGARVGLHPEAVKRYVREMYVKLGATDRGSAVNQGWRRGYLGMWTVGIDYTTRRSSPLVSDVRNTVQ